MGALVQDHAKCIKQPVQNAEMNAKFLLSQPKGNQYIAVIVTQSISHSASDFLNRDLPLLYLFFIFFHRITLVFCFALVGMVPSVRPTTVSIPQKTK